MEDRDQFLDELIEGGPERISDMLFPQIPPEVFGGIEFRAVGRQIEQADVVELLQFSGGVPARSIKRHDNPVVCIVR